MTVAELIALLQAMDPDLPVESMSCDCVHPVTSAKAVAWEAWSRGGSREVVLLTADA